MGRNGWIGNEWWDKRYVTDIKSQTTANKRFFREMKRNYEIEQWTNEWIMALKNRNTKKSKRCETGRREESNCETTL